jgi:methylated-DNA-[protein]-cysteine S-methyltransferase
MKGTLVHTWIDSPVGQLLLVASDAGLAQVGFANGSGGAAPAAASRRGEHRHLAQSQRELAEYFAGGRREFTVPLDPAGTGFQLRVWMELRAIPWGTTASYGDIARRIGAPKASRAVGAANGRNPLAIIVPCHRVIGSSGALVGYGGGMERKRLLLELEGALPG